METEDWVLIELQGDVDTSNGEHMKSQNIGDFHFAKDGTPILIIGYHILYGKDTPMSKPIAVLKKKSNSEGCLNEEHPAEYTVIAIAKRKIIFKTRPKRIVNHFITQ
ncbi:chromosome transmission fidelity protein 8 homolog isoform X2 [Cephus cinctus]|uniref:Chromosome transmission fidelity protein 8 homolog isoform X2 n=1 Tax=Cephus cinctus TaxID=211228 RepID=A0AAJ7BIL5_CEPCN|nr:chromosome transmission fidelity protein 8 homolog isoform X2 [Cephus cinctus]